MKRYASVSKDYKKCMVSVIHIDDAGTYARTEILCRNIARHAADRKAHQYNENLKKHGLLHPFANI